jgi:glutathione peroxidase
MLRRQVIASLAAALVAASAGPAAATQPADGPFVFTAIDGGRLDLADFRGRPVLIVNTASRCAFTGQYDGLQALYERYRDRGLVVLGVPSNSFRQELGSAEAVRSFCEVNFGVDFPMTGLVDVTGPQAHPFYAWAARQGVVPRWNFHKILLDGDGRIVADFASQVEPDAPSLAAAVERALDAPS